MPWLYYEDTGDKVLEEINVRETYTFPNSRLDLVLITYALNGSYLGSQSVKGSTLQLCADSESLLDAALLFGTTYKKSVSDLSHFPLIYSLQCGWEFSFSTLL